MPKDRRSAALRKRVYNGGPSKLRGVIWHKSNGKWEARIYEAGKQRFLGYYTSEVSAARAYDARAVLLHGAAAKVNFPQDYEETCNNPPAYKPVPAKPQALGKDSDKDQSSDNSSCTNSHLKKRRRSSSDSESDYVPPKRSCRKSSRFIGYQQDGLQPASMTDSKYRATEPDLTSDLESEAIMVLATMLSGGTDDSNHSTNLTHQQLPQDSRESSPTLSTGASPCPHMKQRRSIWTPPQDLPARGSTNVEELRHLERAFEQEANPSWTSVLNSWMDNAYSKKDKPSRRNGESQELDRFATSSSMLPEFKVARPPCKTSARDQTRDRPNYAKPMRGTSRFRGVSWCEKGQKWRALIWDEGKQHFLGHYKSEDEAARAYDRALIQRKKKEGTTNFPLSDYKAGRQDSKAAANEPSLERLTPPQPSVERKTVDLGSGSSSYAQPIKCIPTRLTANNHSFTSLSKYAAPMSQNARQFARGSDVVPLSWQVIQKNLAENFTVAAQAQMLSSMGSAEQLHRGFAVTQQLPIAFPAGMWQLHNQSSHGDAVYERQAPESFRRRG